MSSFRLVVVRKDGVVHDSEFKGWHAETAMCRFYAEAKSDKRTLYAQVFDEHSGLWHPYYSYAAQPESAAVVQTPA